MSYDTSKLTKLSALKSLAEKIKDEYATKGDLSALEGRVDDLVTAGGEPNVITSIKVNGTVQAITSKAVDITVPTKVGDLTNDSNYQTSTQVSTAISTAIANAGHASFMKVDSVPDASAAKENVLYLVMNAKTKHYDIYAKVGSSMELLDDTTVDLTGYYTSSELDTKLAGKVDVVSGKGLSTNDYTTAEKTKLSGIEEGANKYSHPSYTSRTSGMYKITVDGTGHVSAVSSVTKSDITGLGIPSENTTYSVASSSSNGLMSSSDKSKLDGMVIATDTEVSEMITEVFSAS